MQGAEAHAPLYDTYAERLHVYCWSLIGDDAPAALHETFLAAARQGGPRGDILLWLYGLARTACVRRGALDQAFTRVRDTDPLRHAAAGLRADHREVLVLSAGGWLEVPDIARLLGVATDTVTQLIGTARKRLEGGVLDVLLPGPIRPEHEDVIAAFEKGTLDTLLARRAPASPPALRADVLASCAAEAVPAQVTRPLPAVGGEGPLVVIGPGASEGLSARRRPGRAFVGAVGLAAAAAAAVGVFATLPTTTSSSAQGGQSLLVPSASGSQRETTATAGRSATTPQQTGASPATSSSAPYTSAARAATSSPPGVLADPPKGGSAPTPSGHLSSPTLSSPASSVPATTPAPTPSETGSSTPSNTPSNTPSGTPQASPTPVDTPTPGPSPTP